jgi:hypothetical protein
MPKLNGILEFASNQRLLITQKRLKSTALDSRLSDKFFKHALKRPIVLLKNKHLIAEVLMVVAQRSIFDTIGLNLRS